LNATTAGRPIFHTAVSFTRWDAHRLARASSMRNERAEQAHAVAGDFKPLRHAGQKFLQHRLDLAAETAVLAAR